MQSIREGVSRARRVPLLGMSRMRMGSLPNVPRGGLDVEKPPITTQRTPKSRPRQKEAIALIQAQPRTKAELKELMGLTSSNLEKLIQILISKGEIIPNPTTGKYETYPKNL